MSSKIKSKHIKRSWWSYLEANTLGVSVKMVFAVCAILGRCVPWKRDVYRIFLELLLWVLFLRYNLGKLGSYREWTDSFTLRTHLHQTL